jgi:hypothetical protein
LRLVRVATRARLAARRAARQRLGRRLGRRRRDRRERAADRGVFRAGHAERLEGSHGTTERWVYGRAKRRLRGRGGRDAARAGGSGSRARALEVAPAVGAAPLDHERSIRAGIAREPPAELRADERVVRLSLRRLLAAADARLTIAHSFRELHGNPAAAKDEVPALRTSNGALRECKCPCSCLCFGGRPQVCISGPLPPKLRPNG